MTPTNWYPHSPRRTAALRRPRGVTLVEVVVAVGVGVVVAGLILGVLTQASRQSDIDARNDRVITAATNSLRRLTSSIERAGGVAPAPDESFEITRLRLRTSDPLTQQPVMFEVQKSVNEKNPTLVSAKYISEMSDSKKPSAGKAGANEFVIGGPVDPTVLGGDPGVAVQVLFRYAWEFKGVEPVWADKGTGRPRLIELRIVARDELGRAQAAQVVSAVTLRKEVSK